MQTDKERKGSNPDCHRDLLFMSKVNEILLLAEGAHVGGVRRSPGTCRRQHGNIFGEVIGVDIIFIILLVAIRFRGAIGWLRGFVLDAGNLAQLASPVNVRQMTLFRGARTCVSIIWAFTLMAIRASSTLFAIPESRIIATYVGCWVHFHMGVAAVGLCAVSTQEVNACWSAVRGRVMGKIAACTSEALALLKILLADGDFVEIMCE
jgi:hypothetical protein